MFNNTIRVLIIAACLLFSIVEMYRNQFLPALLFFIAAALTAYGYIRYGPVWQLSRLVRMGEIKEAEELLNSIKNPNLLSAGQRAYYFFYKGAMEENKNNLDAAQYNFTQALAIGLRTTNDESITNLNLARVYYRQGRLDEARKRLKQASELQHKAAVDVEIEQVRAEIERNEEA